jgi:predicted deacylase
MDGKDITKVFPGNLNGTVTEVLAYRLFNDYILPSDYHVDLRGGELTESHLQHTIYLQDGGAMDETLEAMGVVFGLRYCLPSRVDISHTKPGTLVFEAIKNGIPSIISESGLGYNTQPSDEEVNGHVDGLLNLLIYFKMIEGSYIRPVKQKFLEADRLRVIADSAGVFKHVYDQGELIKKGEVIGKICDLDGSILSTLVAPSDAVVHEMMPRRIVYPGDRVYSLAIVSGETDFTKYTSK